MCSDEAGRWGLAFLQQLLFQSGIFWAELLSFGHYIHEIFKAVPITVMFDRPVVLGTSVEALPEEGLGKSNGDKAAPGFQAAANL